MTDKNGVTNVLQNPPTFQSSAEYLELEKFPEFCLKQQQQKAPVSSQLETT